MSRPAVFLDRDGTINVEKEYLHRIEDWEWIPGAIEAIKRINRMGYLAIVVTNQAGVARGYYTEADVELLHRTVDSILESQGARIDSYYYCPHHPDFGGVNRCSCRKPGPGMLLQAKLEFDIDMHKSFLIGDKALDVEAAFGVGVTPILVMTGYGNTESAKVSDDVARANDLSSAVDLIAEKKEDLNVI